jgi:formylglycine-generating enzyme required for sulfatase activity
MARTAQPASRRKGQVAEDMVFVAGGSFRMGSDHHYPEEAPAHRVRVDSFQIDATPVTNAQFARFVAETGHVTLAEREPNPADYPGAQPDMLRPASVVFTPTQGPVDLSQPMQWWRYVFDADWRRPLGPGSGLAGLEDHPVVHVAFEDAKAYAAWAGKALPTEAEWEFAARGGLDGADYAWGDKLQPGGTVMANFWQGEFPWRKSPASRFERTSPVRAYPPNGYGLHDMIGNVWEWTTDWFVPRHEAPSSPCCVPVNPRGGEETKSYDPAMPDIRIGRRVLKGGSHLCAPSYCRRYRPAARHPQPVDTSTSHVGFRCVRRD